MAIEHQHVYDRIEVSMFHIEFDQPALDFLNISHGFAVPNRLLQILFRCARGTAYNLDQLRCNRI
jgi:hypothetical protein